MSRKFSLTVLVVGSLFVAMQAPTASACWRHRHHRVGTYYSPYHAMTWDTHCCGHGLGYTPYYYSGHRAAAYTAAHTTHSFYRPYTYSTVGYWSPGYHAATYSPAFGHYGYRPARFGGVGMGIGVGRPAGVWTSGYYGSYGYSGMNWYGW